MRYLKIASAKNPLTDYIELNDFNGFLCTSFRSLGITRTLDFLGIKNTQLVVGNKPAFKKYGLLVEILTKYSEYDAMYKTLITFIDRNKKDGFRLYFAPNESEDIRYCLCAIEKTEKTDKLQPIAITLVQTSMWFELEKRAEIASEDDEGKNDFSFNLDESDGSYLVGFYEDEEIEEYYCICLASSSSTTVVVTNGSYNEIPLRFVIRGECINPIITIFESNNDVPIRTIELDASLEKGEAVEINSRILENGVWKILQNGERIQFAHKIKNEYGSPYVYVDNGEYLIKATDAYGNSFEVDVFYQGEYSE